MSFLPRPLLIWLLITNSVAFLLFAWDKLRALDPARSRISEFRLVTIGAIGGWPGGLVAMLLFRHKTAKLSFKVKYTLGLLVWAALMYGAVRWLR